MNMRVDVWIGMCIDVCVEMCIQMCINKLPGVSTGLCGLRSTGYTVMAYIVMAHIVMAQYLVCLPGCVACARLVESTAASAPAHRCV